MSYGNHWNERADGAAEEEWISMAKFREILSHMDAVKLAISQSRQQAIDYFSGIDKSAPFTVTDRFPQYGSYVRVQSGDWPAKISQLLTSLNFKELDQTRAGKERVEQGTRAQMKMTKTVASDIGAADPSVVADEPRDAVPNDVLLSFTSAIKNMRMQLGKREGVYNITKFERELNLGWD